MSKQAKFNPNSYSFNYVASNTGRLFHQSKAFVRGLMGPVGCVRGDTKVMTVEGPIPISALNHKVHVLSWNENTHKFQLSLSGGSYPKGRDSLYRVVTSQGEFVASGHHLILTSENIYQRVDTLSPNQTVCLCSKSLLSTNSDDDASLLNLDVQRLSQKDEDSLVRYATSARQYGRLLLSVTGSDPVSFPSQDDVPATASDCDLSQLYHKDEIVEQLQLHSHLDQSSVHKQIDDCYDRILHPHEAEEGLISPVPCGCNEDLVLQSQQSQPMSESHQTNLQSVACSGSFNDSSFTNGTIISIENLGVNEEYYDMQVWGTHNYVTEDGCIHHNSGKSVTCCMEIFLKAQNATPCADGIRRSRWLVVRNTSPQLETTTIKTWLSWFPEHIFGKMNMKPPITHFIKINDMELEVIFLALDKPDDVKKLLSLECTGIWYNEAREIIKELVDAGTMRVGRYPSKKDKPEDVPDDEFPSWYGVIMDTNPPDDSHWWFKCAEEDAWTLNEFGVKVPKDKFPENMRWEFWSQPSGLSDKAENIANLPKGYYERIASGKDKEWINVYVHGQYGFIQEGKPVYQSEWNDNLHVAEGLQLDPHLPVYIGLDFGLTPTGIFGQRDTRTRWTVLKELVTEDMSVRQFAKLLRQTIAEFCPKNDVYIFGDPSGCFRKDSDADTSFQILRQEGIIARPAPTNNITPRLESVKQCLTRLVDGKPGFLLSKECSILRKGFNGGYKYRLVTFAGETKQALEPDKNNYSHPHDALQYMLMGGGEYQEMRGTSKFAKKTTFIKSNWSVF